MVLYKRFIMAYGSIASLWFAETILMTFRIKIDSQIHTSEGSAFKSELPWDSVVCAPNIFDLNSFLNTQIVYGFH